MMIEQDKVYKCLNPVGLSIPVQTFPLAPRLNTLDGKTIYLSITGEPDITIPLEKRLRSSLPNINWKTKKTYSVDPVQMTDEEMETCDGLIQAVCW
jgi:hypothetical protein